MNIESIEQCLLFSNWMQHLQQDSFLDYYAEMTTLKAFMSQSNMRKSNAMHYIEF